MPVAKPSESALDAALGRSLRRARGAGRPPASIVLAVCARALSLDAPLSEARRYLRAHGAPAVRELCAPEAWRKLAAYAATHAAESPLTRRRRIARRAAIATASGLPAGQASLVALIALTMLDHPESWDSIEVTGVLAARLGVSHACIAARVNKLAEAGVLTILGRSQGTSTRIAFAEPTKEAAERLRDPEVAALVEALADGDDTEATRVFRTVVLPAIGYSDLDEATWSVAMARVLGVHRKVLSEARVNRGMRVMRSLGIDPKSPDSFVEAAHRLSEGEATARFLERDAARKADAAERSASARAAREEDDRIKDVILPLFLDVVGDFPAAPQTDTEKAAATKWARRADRASMLVAGTPDEAPLRRAIRKRLNARGWTKDATSPIYAVLKASAEHAAPLMEETPLPGVLSGNAIPDPASDALAGWLMRVRKRVALVSASRDDVPLRKSLVTALSERGWSEGQIREAFAAIFPAQGASS